MTDFDSWLEGIPLSYAPVSPPYIGPYFGDIPTTEITPLNIDEECNAYFDAPGSTQRFTEEPLPIDPSLTIMPGTAAVMLPEHLAEDGKKLIIHLLRILELPEEDENVNDEPIEDIEEMTATEELEALEPIPEENFDKASVPRTIDGIRVNLYPRPADIKTVVDFRRIGPNRRSFYLARSMSGSYYWVCSPRSSERNFHLGWLIGEYRRRSKATPVGRKSGDVKKLRSGRTIWV